MTISMLTTEDNPYDPFDQYELWQGFDESKGYFTESYLARLALTSPDLEAADQNQAIEDAIDDIVRLNLTGNYKKVTKEV